MHINALRKKVFSKTKLELVTVLKVGYKLKEKQGEIYNDFL
jgi:DNA-binding response OmpR family regulator